MALYDVTIINGITKVETAIGFDYHFPLEVIRTNTSNASMTRTPRGESEGEYVRFANIDDNLGAPAIADYVDLLCEGGYYTDGAGTETSTVDKVARTSLSDIYCELTEIKNLLIELNS